MPAASLHLQPGQRHLCIYSKALQFSHSGAPGQQHLPDGSPPRCPWQQHLSTASRPGDSLIRRRRVLRFGYQSGAPGPDLLTRSFGVRPFIAPIHISARLPCCHLGAAAQTDANLSAHLRRLPTPPTYLRRMRLSPGHGRMYQMVNDDATWPGHCSSQIPPPLREERRRNTLLNPAYLKTFSRK